MDPSWCPGCDRLILPKRYIVPVQPPPTNPPPSTAPPPATTDAPAPDENDPKPPPPPPTPTPVPSSPQVRKKLLIDPTRTRRAYGGGLLQGTGRVRPGGGLRLTQTKKHTPPQPAPAPAPAPDAPILLGNPTAARIGTVHPPLNPPRVVTPAAAPAPSPVRKTRVVISQEPTPLYCSDECRLRDLKNSFIESESAGFAGASHARDHILQLELVKQTVQRNLQTLDRRASAPIQPPTPSDGFPLPILSPVQREAAESDPSPEPIIPRVPPNSLVDPQPPYFSTGSLTSSSGSSSLERLHGSASKNSTIRASAPRSRPTLPARSSSFSTWGSPTKSALAPPARSLFNAAPVAGPSSYHSTSSSNSSSNTSALFDDHMFSTPDADGAETCGTTPSRRGSDSSADSDKKKQKRVSFAEDAKPGDETLGDQVVLSGSPEHVPPSPPKEERRLLRSYRHIPHLDANFLREAVSVSPKDRVKASSLPSYGINDATGDVTTSPGGLANTTTSGAPASRSTSTPILCGSVVAEPPVRRTQYKVPMMWPEDEKRTTESVRVHGELLRGYAKCFGPREGRSFVWGTLWAGHEADAAGRRGDLSAEAKRAQQAHEEAPDSSKEYWQAFEKREAEARARRKAEEVVERLQEERVICELLQGKGMAEEDQPQARRMRRMAYDGMPGPAEMRGLTYKFDRFLYPLVPPKPTIVEKKVRKWDEGRKEWVDEVMREEVFEERKKLFNFSED